MVFNSSDSWVILSPIELSIKKKIEAVGTPLKDWDIQINYGIKTGCNEAFIISTEKRDEILKNCKDENERAKTADLIRPILRGRDIKRYSYQWANLWLINTHNGVKGKIPRVDIDNYPAVKAHLDQYWEQISNRADKGDTPYNLRNCAYMEDFDKPKILYREIGLDIDACMVPSKWFINNKLYMITGENLNNLIIFLNSKIFNKVCIKDVNITGGKGADFMHEIRAPKLNYTIKKEEELYQYYGFTSEEIQYLRNEEFK